MWVHFWAILFHPSVSTFVQVLYIYIFGDYSFVVCLISGSMVPLICSSFSVLFWVVRLFWIFIQIYSSSLWAQCMCSSLVVSVLFTSSYSLLSRDLLLPRFVPGCLISFWCSYKWDCFSNLSDSMLLVYRSATDFCVLILYPAA